MTCSGALRRLGCEPSKFKSPEVKQAFSYRVTGMSSADEPFPVG